MTTVIYKSQSARDAQQKGYGDKNYWDYLDRHAQELHDMYMADGDETKAKQMLAQALRGNDGI